MGLQWVCVHPNPNPNPSPNPNQPGHYRQALYSRTPNPTPIVSLTLESHVGAHEHGRRQVVGNGVVAVGDQTCPVRGRATQYTRARALPLRWHATRALPTQVLVASNDSW